MLVAVVALVAMTGAALAARELTRDDEVAVRAAPSTTTTTTSPTTTTPTTTSTTTTSTTQPTTTVAPRTSAPPTAGTFADVYREVSDGVVRIDADLCEGSGVGTGFLVDRRHAVTAAHVVAGSTALTLSSGEMAVGGEVVGFDEEHDLALVELDRAVAGHLFEFVTAAPEVGTPVGLIGYPLDEPLSLATGTVSGLDRSLPGERGQVDGLIQTDVAANPGNSGGPLLDTRGLVIGVLLAGRTDGIGLIYAMGADVARPIVGGWQLDPRPYDSGPCEPGAEDDISTGDYEVRSDVDHPDADDLVATFQTYADGINSGDYLAAYDVLGPDVQAEVSLDDFTEGNLTSYLQDVRLIEIVDLGPAMLEVRAAFTSLQAPEDGVDGQTCSRWDLGYTMELLDGAWTIAEAAGDDPLPCSDD